MITQILKIKSLSFYVVIVSVIALIVFVQQELFLEKEVSSLLLDSVVEKAELLSMIKRVKWLSLLLVPLIVIIRICFTSGCLFVGSVYNGSNLGYKNLFNIALKCDFVFVLYSAYNLILLIVLGYDQASNIYKYSSLAFLFNASVVEQWVLLPIATLNLFEVLYWLMLAKFYSTISVGSFGKSFWFILSTYGVGLLIYTVFMMFLILYLQS